MRPAHDHVPRAWLLNGHGAGRRLSAEELARWRPHQGALWVDLDARRPADREWVRRASGLSAEQQAAFLADSAWARVQVPGHERLLLVSRLPGAGPDAPADVFVRLHMWLEPRRVLTLRSDALPELDGVAQRLGQGDGPRCAGELLLHGSEELADRLAEDVMRLRAEAAALDLAFEQEPVFPQDDLRRVRRRALRRQLDVDPQRDLLMRVQSLELRWLDVGDEHRWHALLDYIQQASDELEFIVDHARQLQDALAQRTSDQLNRRVYVLAVVSTVVLPMALVAGLFGMNVSTRSGNVFGAHHPAWFVGLVAGMVALGWVAYRLLRAFGLR